MFAKVRLTMSNDIIAPKDLLPEGYANWKKEIITMIEHSKLKAILSVNAEMLNLYWNIGKDILAKQEEQGWGAKVITQLSKDLSARFPEDKGYSVTNLKYMRGFASNYPDFPYIRVQLAELRDLPISQATLDQITVSDGIGQVRLDQISWYHHISLIPKVKDTAERVFYIMETAVNGWSRDVMMLQVANGHIKAKGNAITNFPLTLPPYESDLAKYAFKDPYNFSFLETDALKHERDIEKKLAERITDFLLEMGRGFAYIGRQYHLSVDGDDYYIDILMYHLQLHCYVVIELKAVEFIPEFVSKLNFYISAVDEYVKTTEDKPTIGLLLCRTKSDKKARFALRGVTQPLGIAQYETEKLFEDVASALPQIEDIEKQLEDNE